MNLSDQMYLLTKEECLREASRQFAMADAVGRRHCMNALWQRGGWFALLRWAELTVT